jgi:choloylglycine hydrolase
MRYAKRVSTGCLFFALAIFALHQQTATACTSLALKAEDGAIVYGRTMEWGAFDLNSRVSIIPRGHKFTSLTPDGKPGHSWETKYGVVGLDVLEKDFIGDGMNEKGLVLGVLFFPGFAEYQPYDPEQTEMTVSNLQLANYILSMFSTVDEVRKGIEKIQVVSVEEAALGGEVPLHFTVIDPSGRAIVIQYVKGKLIVHDNPLRVLTNSPPFDWHMTNLRNYLNLSAVAWPAKKLENVELTPIGAGSGFLGLPGDFTPPSRFIRAVAYTQTARDLPDGDEAVYEVLRIMDNFNLPLGAAEGPEVDLELLKGMRSSTIWTSAADLKSLKYYYHTQHNRKLRMIDLNRIDFTKPRGGIQYLSMDQKKSQEIEDVTPEN